MTDTQDFRVKLKAAVKIIEDDAMLAAYYGVPIEDVQQARKSLVTPRPVGVQISPDEPGIVGATGHVTAAEVGSANLLRAIQAYMRKYHPNSDVARAA